MRYLFLLVLVLTSSVGDSTAREVWRDDFSGGLGAWEISDPEAIYTRDSGDPQHGQVMVLNPAHARLHALISGSETWSMYRIEGDVLFPTDEHNYLGFIYNYIERNGRADLGSIYIKGNGSYIRVNPRRDWNPGRRLYEEMRVELEGDDAIVTNKWQRFAAEVNGRVCHFYVGDMKTPKVTFDFFEFDEGKVGFKPRVVGGPVWIDNVRVLSIMEMTYNGPSLPAIDYNPDRMVTDWEVAGPFDRSIEALERTSGGTDVLIDGGDGRQYRWTPFETDPRGAVITARVVDFLGPRTVGYFRTVIDVPAGERATLEFSAIDDMTMWLNGKFEGYSYDEYFAWYDFIENPDHPATKYAGLPLVEGKNVVVIRIRGGTYAAGGFYATVVREKDES